MAIKFDKVKAGDVLYDVHRVRMGNTRTARLGCWTVKILEIDPDGAGAWVSWNGNSRERWTRRKIESLRRTPKPEVW